MSLVNKKVAILTAEDGVERVELEEPRRALEDAGAEVVHVTPGGGRVRTFEQTNPAGQVTADASVEQCDPSEFDCLVLPGGYISPDKLRRDSDAVSFVNAFVAEGKPVGVICHGPWTLIEAGAVHGRTLAAVASLKTDIRNAGGEWVDEEVHVDRGAPSVLVSGRDFRAVEAFVSTLVNELETVSTPAK